MHLQLESQDIEQIALRVYELLKPLLNGNRTKEDDIIFDVKGIAEYLHVSDKWIYQRTQTKEIPYVKVKGVLMFRKREIDKWLQTHSIPSTT